MDATSINGDITYEYWVTSLFDGSLGCSESIPSEVAIVELNNPLDDFSLLTPENNSMVTDLTPMFTWSGASEGDLRIERLSGVQVSNSKTQGPKQTKRVLNNNNLTNTNKEWSSHSSFFKSKRLSQREVANSTTNTNDSRDVTGYHFYLSQDENFENIHISQYVTENFYEPSSLEEDELYYWKVVAIYDGVPTLQSETRTFWTNSQNSPPSEVLLISPEFEEEVGLAPTFIWTKSDDPDLYDFVSYTINYGIDVASMVEINTESDTTYTFDTELSDNSEYYWFITATDQSEQLSQLAFTRL